MKYRLFYLFIVLVSFTSNFFCSNVQVDEKGDISLSFPSSCFEKKLSIPKCENLKISCLNCSYNESCNYGEKSSGHCYVPEGIECTGQKQFSVEVPCYFCYQLPKEKYTCGPRANCKVASSQRKRLIVNCTVSPQQHCLGRRKFLKSFACNWTSGYRWSTAFLLSVTLGGFGVDRFYLGHWEEGLAKLFGFGGLGVWTLVDIVLVGVGYITPGDGSLYIF